MALRKRLEIGPELALAPAFLAPMAGISDAPFRHLAHRFGAGLVVSEMVASEALARGVPFSRLQAEGGGVDPHCIQLAGRQPEWMAHGARIAAECGARIVDINMGCPSKRVTTGYSGSALMRDLDLALRMIEATVEAVDLPVTLKMRLGWDRGSLNGAELARRAEAAGVRMITVHGRTRCQFFKGAADWAAVGSIKDAVGIPVVVNGDITSHAEASEALRLSGADAVMIGRGARGRPWLVGQIAARLQGLEAQDAPAGPELLALIRDHHAQMLRHYGPDLGLRVARKHLDWYLSANFDADQPDNRHKRREILTASRADLVYRLLESWFATVEQRQAA